MPPAWLPSSKASLHRIPTTPNPPSPAGYSKFAKQHYAADGLYPRGTNTWLLFGAETSGLPPQAHEAATTLVKIPMSEAYVRSLNLATSTGACVGSRAAPGAAPGAAGVAGWGLGRPAGAGTAVLVRQGCTCPFGSLRSRASSCAGIGVMEVLRQKDGAVLPEDM